LAFTCCADDELKEARRSSRRWQCNHLCGTEHSESNNDCTHKIRLLNATINSERRRHQQQQCKHSDHAGMTAMVKNYYSIGGYDCCTKSSIFGDGISSGTASGGRSTTSKQNCFCIEARINRGTMAVRKSGGLSDVNNNCHCAASVSGDSKQ